MYHLHWTERADNDLAQLWLLADSHIRAALDAAVNEIDRRLGKDPFSEGESREEGERISFEYPVGFSFRVEPERRVVVGHIWSIVRRVS